MQTYKLSYDWQEIARVEIDKEKCQPLLKEMILFWMGGEEKIEDNGGNIVQTWLKQLGAFIVRRGRAPDGDEGWTKLDGTYGIKILSCERWEVDEDSIEIESI